MGKKLGKQSSQIGIKINTKIKLLACYLFLIQSFNLVRYFFKLIYHNRQNFETIQLKRESHIAHVGGVWIQIQVGGDGVNWCEHIGVSVQAANVPVVDHPAKMSIC